MKQTIRDSRLFFIKYIPYLWVGLFCQQALHAEKVAPETEFIYTLDRDKGRVLNYTVRYVKGSAKYSTEAEGIPVNFYAGYPKVKLGTVLTNSYGTASLVWPKEEYLPAREGNYSFWAEIENNEWVETAIDSVSVSDLSIEMNFTWVDSVPTVVFSTFEMNEQGERQAVSVDMVFYVPRTFSNLKIAEASSEENGEGEFEFPTGIPGDTSGFLTVIAKVEDHEKYANVSIAQTVDWGTPTNYEIAKFHRALWTTFAPAWMIVTLTILLLGVWGHYLYVVIKMIQIRNESKTSNQ